MLSNAKYGLSNKTWSPRVLSHTAQFPAKEVASNQEAGRALTWVSHGVQLGGKLIFHHFLLPLVSSNLKIALFVIK